MKPRIKKHHLLLLLILILNITNFIRAQTPQAISIQTTARNSSGELIINKRVSIRINIINKNSEIVFSERQIITVNQNGVISAILGEGEVERGVFEELKWSGSTLEISLEIDEQGGVDYTDLGIIKTLSVPYAFHAKTVDTVLSPIMERDSLYLTSSAGDITTSDIITLGNLSGTNTGDHDMEIYMPKDSLNIVLSNLVNTANSSNLKLKCQIDSLEILLEDLNRQILIELGYIVTDYEGNYYRAVQIGRQIWMAENLRSTTYADGFPIPNIDDRAQDGISGLNNTAWGSLLDNNTFTSAAYSWYNNDSAKYASKYGALYTWAAAMGARLGNDAVSSNSSPSTVQGVCPTGWHLPSNAEWVELEDFLANNGYNFDGTFGGGRMKVAKSMADTVDWFFNPGTGVVGNTDFSEYRNKSGFTARPAGLREAAPSGRPVFMYNKCYFWSSTEYDASYAIRRYLHDQFADLNGGSYYKSHGYSVRCVKD